jgi:hypothetical protein
MLAVGSKWNAGRQQGRYDVRGEMRWPFLNYILCVRLKRRLIILLCWEGKEEYDDSEQTTRECV